MQQIYKRKPMPRCDFNKVVLQLYWNHTLAWVFSCAFASYFPWDYLLVMYRVYATFKEACECSFSSQRSRSICVQPCPFNFRCAGTNICNWIVISIIHTQYNRNDMSNSLVLPINNLYPFLYPASLFQTCTFGWRIVFHFLIQKQPPRGVLS